MLRADWSSERSSFFPHSQSPGLNHVDTRDTRDSRDTTCERIFRCTASSPRDLRSRPSAHLACRNPSRALVVNERATPPGSNHGLRRDRSPGPVRARRRPRRARAAAPPLRRVHRAPQHRRSRRHRGSAQAIHQGGPAPRHHRPIRRVRRQVRPRDAHPRAPRSRARVRRPRLRPGLPGTYPNV